MGKHQHPIFIIGNAANNPIFYLCSIYYCIYHCLIPPRAMPLLTFILEPYY